ncbi:MAG: flagellar type III secretion system protein FlhB [Paracoccaceae bacterium]|nr:flagellar type III secretion system protein FlhB [Paracoccaceae bacterium]
MSEEESAEKSHEPSPRKLEKAREKGEIPRAPDLLTAMAYLGMLISGLAIGTGSMTSFGEALLPLIEQPDRLEGLFFREGAATAAGSLLQAALAPALPLLFIPGLMVLLTLIATRGLLFTPSKLTPKISRLSVISNAKNKYGRRGLFEFFKSFVKLTVYSLVLAVFLIRGLEEIVGSARANPGEVIMMMTSLMLKFLTVVAVIAAAIGAIDFLWQRADHMRRNRMSQKELRDEMKDAEGDPAMKQQRRARAQEIALNQMMADVPTADVVIVNPTHYAIALKWSREPGAAPVCVAKGVDEIAARIREIAGDAAVPIHSDPPTARAVFATTEIGQEIAPEHYKPVAAAIRFAEAMRQKARAGGWK